MDSLVCKDASEERLLNMMSRKLRRRDDFALGETAQAPVTLPSEAYEASSAVERLLMELLPVQRLPMERRRAAGSLLPSAQTAWRFRRCGARPARTFST